MTDGLVIYSCAFCRRQISNRLGICAACRRDQRLMQCRRCKRMGPKRESPLCPSCFQRNEGVTCKSRSPDHKYQCELDGLHFGQHQLVQGKNILKWGETEEQAQARINGAKKRHLPKNPKFGDPIPKGMCGRSTPTRPFCQRRKHPVPIHKFERDGKWWEWDERIPGMPLHEVGTEKPRCQAKHINGKFCELERHHEITLNRKEHQYVVGEYWYRWGSEMKLRRGLVHKEKVFSRASMGVYRNR